MSSEWQQYKFVDKTGKCFKAFAEVEDEDSSEYNKRVAALLMASQEGKHTFEVGDMCVFRDELEEAGFRWGVDFYVQKVGKGK